MKSLPTPVELRIAWLAGWLEARGLREGACEILEDARECEELALVAELFAHPRPRSDADVLAELALCLRRRDAASESAVLRIDRDARTFQLVGQPVVSLGRRRALWHVLDALVRAHIAARGSALDVDRLVAAGWPSERIAPRSAHDRVRAAIATLRRAGLREVVITRDLGYAIDPRIRIEHVTSRLGFDRMREHGDHGA